VGEISGSDGGEYEDTCLLGCCAVLSGRSLPKFQIHLLRPSLSPYYENVTNTIANQTKKKVK
jgi:hypothetical protein